MLQGSIPRGWNLVHNEKEVGLENQTSLSLVQTPVLTTWVWFHKFLNFSGLMCPFASVYFYQAKTTYAYSEPGGKLGWVGVLSYQKNLEL